MKYIVKQCPNYLIGGCQRTGQQCKDISTCIIKDVINESLEYQDKGRIDLILNNKCLTPRGHLAKKIIQILECEEIIEREPA